MSFYDQLDQAARTGGPAAANALVTREAEAGNPDALFVLGQWRLWAIQGRRDPAAGLALLRQAAAAGHGKAGLAAAALIGNGTGTAADLDAARALLLQTVHPLAARQIALLDAMTERVPTLEPINESPWVGRIEGLLSADECAYLIERAAPKLGPSYVIDPVSGYSVRNPRRTSDGMAFAPPDEDPAIRAICQRIARATGTDVDAGEPLHMLRYRPGEAFHRHHDALPGVANQRTMTVLVYLNEDFDAGETEFPQAGLKIRERAGDAITFRNLLPDGSSDPDAVHAGLPVARGEKWLATRWIRQRPNHPWQPETQA